MAGFLVFPADQYPDVFPADSLFARFGVLLPNLIVAVCLTIMMVLALFFLPSHRPLKQVGQDVDDEKCSLLVDSVKIKGYSTMSNSGDENQHDSIPCVYVGKIFCSQSNPGF